MNILEHNRAAWNKQSTAGSRWCTPVGGEEIQAAREGNWSVILTPNKTVPRRWFGSTLKGKKLLCLASGGGQQAPLLAAA